MINRYGLVENEPKTLEKIGKEVHLAKDNVRKDQDKALWKLRGNLPCAKVVREDVDMISGAKTDDKIIHLIDREMLIK